MFRSAKDPLSAYATGVRGDEAPLFHVYEAGCKELACQLMGESDLDESFHARVKASGRISPTQMNGVQMAMERAAGESVQILPIDAAGPCLNFARSPAQLQSGENSR